jgi:hypothetical protein
MSLGMHHPKNLRATASNSYILNLYGGLSNRRLFARRPTNERRSKKVACTKSAFFDLFHNPQNQHRKSQQDSVKKKQNTKSQTQEFD